MGVVSTVEGVGCPNWVNRSIFVGDNLNVLRGMNSASVDLVYLDPPFNSNRNYSAPVGSEAAGASFKDAWTLDDIDEAWLGQIAEQNEGVYKVCDAAGMTHSKGMKSYLCFMAVRLMELHRVLRDTGSLYLHVDDTAGHYLKMICDAVFGRDNFRNDIAWCYRAENLSRKKFARGGDTIFFYTKSNRYHFSIPSQMTDVNDMKKMYPLKDKRGDYKLTPCTNSADRPNMFYEWNGHTRQWRFQRETMEKYYLDDRLVYNKEGIPRRKTYAHESLVGGPMGDKWSDIPGRASKKEKTGYPTQKPLALLERIISASSNEGDVVLDPFCGCATTCEASERLGREWVGIDLSSKAYDLIRMRLQRAADEDALFKGGKLPDVIVRLDIPMRDDILEPVEHSTIKHKLFGEQEGRCNGCGHVFEFRHFEVDHIVARALGGTDHESNLQLLCSSCNRIKGKKSQAELMVRLKQLRLVV